MYKVLKLKLSGIMIGYTDSNGITHPLESSNLLIHELKDTAIVSNGEEELTIKEFKKHINVTTKRRKKSSS